MEGKQSKGGERLRREMLLAFLPATCLQPSPASSFAMLYRILSDSCKDNGWSTDIDGGLGNDGMAMGDEYSLA